MCASRLDGNRAPIVPAKLFPFPLAHLQGQKGHAHRIITKRKGPARPPKPVARRQPSRRMRHPTSPQASEKQLSPLNKGASHSDIDPPPTNSAVAILIAQLVAQDDVCNAPAPRAYSLPYESSAASEPLYTYGGYWYTYLPPPPVAFHEPISWRNFRSRSPVHAAALTSILEHAPVASGDYLSPTASSIILGPLRAAERLVALLALKPRCRSAGVVPVEMHRWLPVVMLTEVRPGTGYVDVMLLDEKDKFMKMRMLVAEVIACLGQEMYVEMARDAHFDPCLPW